MTETRTFEGVTADVWERIKEVGRRDYGTVFEPPDGNSGTATTPTPLGPVVLAYEHDPATARITYRVVRKPMLVMSGPLWAGLSSTIETTKRALATRA